MLKLLHIAPFVRMLLPMLFGIILQKYFFVSHILGGISVAILLITISYCPYFNKRYYFRFIFGLGLFILLFFWGVFVQYNSSKNLEWFGTSEIHLYEAVIIEEPVRKPKTLQCKIRIFNTEEDISIINKNAVVYISSDSNSLNLKSGRNLLLYTSLENAPDYLRKKSVAAIGYVKADEWMGLESDVGQISPYYRMLSFKNDLLFSLRKMIPDLRYYSIAVGLLFGNKENMDKDLRQSFANIGAGHILAVSGLHFSIIFGMFYVFLSFIGNSLMGRLVKQIILLPSIWGFACLAGLSPSVIRAALMMSLWGVGQLLFRRSFSLNTMSATAFCMLLFNPLYLYDIGFQLSFSAVTSILLINPYLNNLYQTKNKIINYLWQLIAVSISAQLGVLPLSIFYFKQVPLVFLLTNICLIPLVTLLLFLIILCLLLHSLFSTSSVVLLLLNKTLECFTSIIYFLDQLPYRSIDHVNMNIFDLIVSYVLITGMVLLLIKKRIVYIYILIVVVLFRLICYLC